MVTAKSKDCNVDNLDDDKQKRIAGTGGLLFPSLPDNPQADDDLDNGGRRRIIKGTAPKQNDRAVTNETVTTPYSNRRLKECCNLPDYYDDVHLTTAAATGDSRGAASISFNKASASDVPDDDGTSAPSGTVRYRKLNSTSSTNKRKRSSGGDDTVVVKHSQPRIKNSIQKVRNTTG